MQSYLRKLPIAGVLTALAIGVAFAALHNQNAKTQDIKRDDPTPIQEGLMTQKQREHSKLYKKYQGLNGLRSRANEANSSGDVEVSILPGVPELSPGGSPSAKPVKEDVDRADAVLVGTVTHKSSQLTEEGNFIFTDYDFKVEQILKNNSSSPIPVAGTVTITRPGGRILLNNRIYSALDRTARPLNVGKRYVVFLKYVPTSKDYSAFGSAVRLEPDDTITALSDDVTLGADFRSGNKASDFLAKVQAAIAADDRKGKP